jgi:hypothetical protein
MYARRMATRTRCAALVFAILAMSALASCSNSSSPTSPPLVCQESLDAGIASDAYPSGARWPSPLATYCRSELVAHGYEVVSHTTCSGYDVVVFNTSIDTTAFYVYAADGSLVAVGDESVVGRICVAGPAQLALDPWCRGSQSASDVPCCPPPTDQYTCPHDSGDAGGDGG